METPNASMKFDGCGGVVRDARIATGKSLRQVAEEAGCGPGHLSKIENSVLALSIGMIEQLSNPLGVDANELALRCLKISYPGFVGSPAGKAFQRILSKS